MFPMPPLVLADIGQWIGLGAIVITILSWLVNTIKEAGNKPPMRQRPAQQGGKDLRSEIEVFLEELTKPQPPKSEAARSPSGPTPGKRPPAEPQRAEKKSRKPPRPAAPPSPPPQKPKAARPLSQQHLPASNLGTGVQQHLQQHMAAGGVTAQAEQHAGHRVEAAIMRDLGSGGLTTAAGTTVATAAVHPIAQALRQPGGMRQAVLLNEILQKPKALRSGR